MALHSCQTEEVRQVGAPPRTGATYVRSAHLLEHQPGGLGRSLPNLVETVRDLIRERQREGHRGCQRALSEGQVAERRRVAAGEAQVAREIGIFRETLYQYLREGEETRCRD